MSRGTPLEASTQRSIDPGQSEVVLHMSTATVSLPLLGCSVQIHCEFAGQVSKGPSGTSRSMSIH